MGNNALDQIVPRTCSPRTLPKQLPEAADLRVLLRGGVGGWGSLKGCGPAENHGDVRGASDRCLPPDSDRLPDEYSHWAEAWEPGCEQSWDSYGRQAHVT